MKGATSKAAWEDSQWYSGVEWYTVSSVDGGRYVLDDMMIDLGEASYGVQAMGHGVL